MKDTRVSEIFFPYSISTSRSQPYEPPNSSIERQPLKFYLEKFSLWVSPLLEKNRETQRIILGLHFPAASARRLVQLPLTGVVPSTLVPPIPGTVFRTTTPSCLHAPGPRNKVSQQPPGRRAPPLGAAPQTWPAPSTRPAPGT